MPEILAELATVQMHANQTSNLHRNITADPFAGGRRGRGRRPAPLVPRSASGRPSTPEFAYLPRKFQIAFNGAEDRVVIAGYDIGLDLVRNEAGEMASAFWSAAGLSAPRSSAGRSPLRRLAASAHLLRGHPAGL